MNKRGFELSINFIVTLILAVVVLSFGIYFVKMIYERSTELKIVLDQQTEMELERLMDSGEKVSLYPGRRTVGNGELAKFGLGILNINADTNFEIKITYSTTTDPSDDSNHADWIKTIYTPDPTEFPETIEKNNKKKILIGIIPSGESGKTYVFDIDVLVNEKKYDFTHKIYVTVE